MSHTLGEWEISDHDYGNVMRKLIFIHVEDEEICQIQAGPNAKANAFLIKSAPKMLKALRNVAECITVDLRDCTAAEGFDAKALKAVIAQAEGKEKPE